MVDGKVVGLNCRRKEKESQNKPDQGRKTHDFGARIDAKPELWTEWWSFGVME